MTTLSVLHAILIMMEDKVLEVLSDFGIPVIIIIGFWAILSNYDNFRQLFADFFNSLSFLGNWFRRKAIKTDIEARASKAIKNLDAICPELSLPEIKVSWVKDEELESIFDSDKQETIVMVRYNKDNSQNVINATTAYIKKSLLPVARPFIEEKLMSAIDYSVIVKFLAKTKNHDIIISKFVQDNRVQIVENTDRVSCVKSIDDAGLFSRILLRELSVWGTKIVGNPLNENYPKESMRFMEFLYNISIREHEDYTPLQYIGNDIKVGVLLVAKPETYFEAGAAPYLRRIKEGFTNGIRTYYLLARNEKIEILHAVYSELIASGNFELKNGPLEYNDKEGRRNICYCLEVVEEGEISKTVIELNYAIEKRKKLDTTISWIGDDEIYCYFKRLEIIVPLENISKIHGINLWDYYQKGSEVQLYVESKDDRGRFIGSFINTNSNPQSLIDANYSKGKIINAVVEYAEDEFVKLRVRNDNIECVAFRRNLTYSHYQFLHNLFPIGSEHQFVIDDINYIKRTFEVKLADLRDPWDSMQSYVGQSVECKIMQKTDTCLKTEIQDGILGIIPLSELSWFENDSSIDKYKLNDDILCRIISINRDRRIVILSAKPSENPYELLFERLKENSEVTVWLINDHAKGVNGLIDRKYKVFIPISECHIGENFHKYSLGKNCRVRILSLSEDRRSFIGSFKPYIENPLVKKAEQILSIKSISTYSIQKVYEKKALLKIFVGTEYENAVLFASEITDLCYIEHLDGILKALPQLPMGVLSIDYDRNLVILSHKEFVSSLNSYDILEYGTIYRACIIGNKFGKAIIIIQDFWTHAYLDTNNNYSVGTIINVILARKSGSIPTFCES